MAFQVLARYKEEQIVALLKNHEKGVGTVELCRRHGIIEQTFIAGRRSTAASSPAMPRSSKALENGR
jgi:putative transposase